MKINPNNLTESEFLALYMNNGNMTLSHANFTYSYSRSKGFKINSIDLHVSFEELIRHLLFGSFDFGKEYTYEHRAILERLYRADDEFIPKEELNSRELELCQELEVFGMAFRDKEADSWEDGYIYEKGIHSEGRRHAGERSIPVQLLDREDFVRLYFPNGKHVIAGGNVYEYKFKRFYVNGIHFESHVKVAESMIFSGYPVVRFTHNNKKWIEFLRFEERPFSPERKDIKLLNEIVFLGFASVVTGTIVSNTGERPELTKFFEFIKHKDFE